MIRAAVLCAMMFSCKQSHTKHLPELIGVDTTKNEFHFEIKVVIRAKWHPPLKLRRQ